VVTAQIRRGAPTVEAAHALDREPVAPRLTLGSALTYLFGGLAIVALAYLFAFFAAVL
jgi:hypothetical protein